MTIYREEPWTSHAQCRSIGVDAFYPAKGDDWNVTKAVCLTSCSVRLQCLDYAMRMELGISHHFRAGIFGGLGPLARAKYEPQWLAEQVEGAA